MPKKKSKLKWIDTTLVKSPYYIALCLSSKDFKHEMRRLKIPKRFRVTWILRGFSGRVHEFECRGKLLCLVCVRKNSNPLEVTGLLIHEAVHIWQKTRNKLGEFSPSKEFEAYAIQSIAQRLIEAYKGVK